MESVQLSSNKQLSEQPQIKKQCTEDAFSHLLPRPLKADHIVSSLLKLLPTGATSLDPDAKILCQAFKRVESELKRRAKQSSVAVLQSSAVLTVILHSVLPKDIALLIFSSVEQWRLPQLALVQKSFVDVALDPSLWTSLFPPVMGGLQNPGSEPTTNMSQLIRIVQRPQFSRLTRLFLPRGCKLGKGGAKKLALHLPNLRSIHTGAFHDDDASKKNWGEPIRSGQLLQLTTDCPTLDSLHVNVWDISTTEFIASCRIMGSRLVDLHLDLYGNSRCALSNDALHAIAESCPSLERLGLTGSAEAQCLLRPEGMIAIIDSCPLLSHMALPWNAWYTSNPVHRGDWIRAWSQIFAHCSARNAKRPWSVIAISDTIAEHAEQIGAQTGVSCVNDVLKHFGVKELRPNVTPEVLLKYSDQQHVQGCLVIYPAQPRTNYTVSEGPRCSCKHP